METIIRVIFDGETYTIQKFGPADLVAFERHFGVSAQAFTPDETGKSPDVRFEWLCFLVFRGLRKLGVIDKTAAFDDDFLDRIDDLEVPDEDEKDETADPTDPVALTA